jgi:hypothetical protein
VTQTAPQSATRGTAKPPKRQSGVRSLAALSKNASTSRMLNLGLIAQRHGNEPEHGQYPFFQNQMPNRCILLKHRVRPDERILFHNYPPVATKLLFPYDWNDLTLGGRSVLVGEHGFKDKLHEVVGQDPAVPQADWVMLDLIDALPSLDPFLLREQVARGGYQVADWYFQISASDAVRMRDFIGSHIAALIELAFEQTVKGAQHLVTQTVEALLSVRGGSRLEPLRIALGLDPEEFRDSTFCWKGFLYYKWSAKDHEAAIEQLLCDLKRVKVAGAPHAYAELEIEKLLEKIKQSVDIERQAVRAALRVYEDAFDDLVLNRKPVAFRKFLRESPRMFLQIGDKLGIMTHISSFWKFRFPEGTPPFLPYSEAVELFREFESGFAREQSGAVAWG